MDKTRKSNAPVKFLTPDNLYEQLKHFTAGMAVTKGSFELTVDKCLIQDIEWNHMDQMHRYSIHRTYEKGVRIATGSQFAVSLTQWGRWPFLITVSDVYVAKGLFYQSLTIAGVLFIHSIISMEQVGESVKLKDEWYIASNKLFKWIHPFLSKKLYKLNKRLQDEDEPVRQGRYHVRKQGYRFQTDVPDYYNSNVMGTHTIYPELGEQASIAIASVTDTPKTVQAGNLGFIVQQDKEGRYLIWPAVCPHEGGPLIQGHFCEAKVSCPWHSLQFSAAVLSSANPSASRNGFEFTLSGQDILVRQLRVIAMPCKDTETLTVSG